MHRILSVQVMTLLAFAGLFCGFHLYGDSPNLPQVNSDDAAQHAPYLSDAENKVITYINWVRTSPQEFLTKLLIPYIEENSLQQNKWAKSLQATLKTAPKRSALRVRKDLHALAKKHALDMGKSGQVGHDASNGTTYPDRVGYLLNTYESTYENCDYGNETAIDIVMSMLIDEGIEDLGHRNNILREGMRYVGVSIQPHSKYRTNCVQEFAGPLVE